MSWTLTTSGAAVANAGKNVNSTIAASGSALARWSDEAEGIIEHETRRKWVDNYSTLITPVKNALDSTASSLIAMRMIAYDPTGYISREADILLNVNDERIAKGLQFLKDFKSNTIQTP